MDQTYLYRDMYAKARSGLLIMLFLTVANLTTVVLSQSETVFVFSSTLAELAFGLMMGAYMSADQPMYWVILGGLALAAILVTYFLCWLFCKKKSRWLVIGTLLFIVDSVARVVLLVIAFANVDDPGRDIDLLPTVFGFAFSAWVLYYLIRGVWAARKLAAAKSEE